VSFVPFVPSHARVTESLTAVILQPFFFSFSFENVIFDIALEQDDEQLSPLITTLNTCYSVMCTYVPEHVLQCYVYLHP